MPDLIKLVQSHMRFIVFTERYTDQDPARARKQAKNAERIRELMKKQRNSALDRHLQRTASRFAQCLINLSNKELGS